MQQAIEDLNLPFPLHQTITLRVLAEYLVIIRSSEKALVVEQKK